VRRFLIFLVVAPAVLVGVIVTAMLAGGSDGGTTKQLPPQRLTLEMRAETELYNLAVRPDRPVLLTIVNYEPRVHTFTIADLGVNRIVPAALPGSPTRTVISFTAPFGVHHWTCETCINDSGDIYAVVTSRGSAGYPPGGFHWTPAA
jgi:hypothetical protein